MSYIVWFSACQYAIKNRYIYKTVHDKILKLGKNNYLKRIVFTQGYFFLQKVRFKMAKVQTINWVFRYLAMTLLTVTILKGVFQGKQICSVICILFI